MSEGRAGDNVGILLRGIRRDEVERGQVRRQQICGLSSQSMAGSVPRMVHNLLEAPVLYLLALAMPEEDLWS